MKKTQHHFPTGKTIFVCAVALALTLVTLPVSHAQTFSVVYNFTGGNDGSEPVDGFTADPAGNLYASTSNGGAFGYGVVFKVSKTGVQSVLHSFTAGTDGQNPQGGLIRDKAGNLYGTTQSGGATGNGAVYMISGAGKETILYSFKGSTDGASPQSGLTIDASGNLYGTTDEGGQNYQGTVFRLTPPKTGTKWVETILYSFGSSSSDGTVPVAGVTLGKAGTLFGTTSQGGLYGYGTVFQLTHSGTVWTETILQHFQNGNDGSVPYGGLIADKAGNFYGTATQGGSNGGGTIFELTPATGGGWTFNVLYSVPGWGISGSFRNLAIDASGVLYGTTHCDGDNSAGTVFKLTPASGSWTYTLLYTFGGGNDGLYSFSNPVLVQGSLYGTTQLGGSHSRGVVWKVTL
jgi:uncharacterized repeat protein (TIGR03803 family)